MRTKMKKDLTKEDRSFMEHYGLTEEEMRLFQTIYRREMIFKTIIGILACGLIIVVLLVFFR